MQAAYVALSKLYPAQQATFDARRAISLTILNATENAASVADGIAWGESVANQIWAWRLTDGIANTTPSWPGNTALGQWRPTPNAPAPGTSANGAGYPQFFNMTTWAIAAASQFRPPAPPSLSSAKYAKDFNEVKTMGSQSSATRTPDQTFAAMLWNSSTAVNLWNHVALSLLDGRGRHRDDDEDDNWHGKDRRDTLLDHAKLLGEVDVAMADAALVCWDAKYTYNFWRPITAIRELADDGNGATTPDAGWTPLLVTPNHPSYISGHSCISSAAATVLAKEFGEHTHFTVESDTMQGVARSFRGFSSALEDVKNARIFAGIHFRFDCDFGQVAGAAAAEYVLQHAFQRVH
jgi:hypothetical protein